MINFDNYVNENKTKHNKRLQTFDRITTYPYGSVSKICESEMLMVKNLFFEKLK